MNAFEIMAAHVAAANYYRDHEGEIEALLDELVDRMPDIENPADLFAAIVVSVENYPEPERVVTMFALALKRLIGAKAATS